MGTYRLFPSIAGPSTPVSYTGNFLAGRERLTALYERRLTELGFEAPTEEVEKVAVMTTCMANGFLMEQLLTEDLGEELYGTMMEIFFRGLAAMFENPEFNVTPLAKAKRDG